jgi:hypothetical protein
MKEEKYALRRSEIQSGIKWNKQAVEDCRRGIALLKKG